MSPNQYEYAEQPVQRGRLLSFLCILTFIGSGFQLSNQFASYMTAEEQASHPEKVVEVFSELVTDDMPESVETLMEEMLQTTLDNNTVVRIRRYALGMILAGLFTFLGALGMWRLRKWGYHSYLAGTLAYVVIPWLAFDGLKATTQGYAALFVGILMMVLYTFRYRRLS